MNIDETGKEQVIDDDFHGEFDEWKTYFWI